MTEDGICSYCKGEYSHEEGCLHELIGRITGFHVGSRVVRRFDDRFSTIGTVVDMQDWYGSPVLLVNFDGDDRHNPWRCRPEIVSKA